MEGVESRAEPRPDAKAAFSPVPHTVHTSFSLALLSSETKNPSYFLTKMCFVTSHLVPFYRRGVSLRSLLALWSLLISVKMEVFEVC